MPTFTRRRVMRGCMAAIAAGATAAAAAPAAKARTHSVRSGPDGHGKGRLPHQGEQCEGPAPFDELYRGRRIQGIPVASGHHHEDPGYLVLVDGTELHVMQNVDGTWVSIVDHYELFAGPRAAARSAVDNLAGADLTPQA
ncbi:tyrosinase cofactor [Streptomyces sp. NBC_00885]|nr:tyrosinase cofactor [Streptomyces sp. NBC_00885]